jgi:hypothetical protein
LSSLNQPRLAFERGFSFSPVEILNPCSKRKTHLPPLHSSPILVGSEKPHHQLIHRLGLPLIRDTLDRFRQGLLHHSEASSRLGLAKSRFYQLYSEFLRARVEARLEHWVPGTSGGDHHPDLPDELAALLRKRLGSKPPASYAFAAAEAHRLLGLEIHRATVRRWAHEHGLAHQQPPLRFKAPVRRWQRSRIGELWQYDATPHRWFPGNDRQFPLLNLLDDCSRLHLHTRIYQSENLLAHLDLLASALRLHGLPLEIYVDYHSLFFSHSGVTQLQEALHFYGVSFRYAPTPEAKGKIERDHQVWQARLPAFFASENIGDLARANAAIDELRLHRNAHQPHRELDMTPKAAWDAALAESRSALRPTPNCPWWPFVWSLRSGVQVQRDRRLVVAARSFRVDAPPGSWLILCTHPSGHHSVLRHHPKPDTRPVILFSNLPKS